MKTKLAYSILKILTGMCIAWIVVGVSNSRMFDIIILQVISCIGGVVAWFMYDWLRRINQTLPIVFRIAFWSMVVDVVFIGLYFLPPMRSFIETLVLLDSFEKLLFLMSFSFLATLLGVISVSLRLRVER